MAMVNGVFVNLGCCGYSESAEGLGDTSLSGYRNFGKHPWPQMDIGSIKFYNPRVCVNEVESNRRLTRNQAIWLTNKITTYINTLDIPFEEDFDNTENGRTTEEYNLSQIPTNASDEKVGRTIVKWDGKGREIYSVLHSLEASLTEAVRDNPSWARPCDHQTLVKVRALLKVE